MTFSSPWLLLLLLALPVFVWLGWPSRGPSRRREIASLVLRLLFALLLCLSLAGLEVRRAADELSVIFLVDHSDSMSPLAQQLAQDYVRQALQHLGPNDRAGVIIFGGNALVERPLSASKELDNFTSKVSTLQTDLAEAIRLGLALLPADTARRLVVLSDGRETTGDALQAAQFAKASGTQIIAIPLAQTMGETDAQITAVEAPPRLRQGEQFGLKLTVESTISQRVGVRVLADAAIAYEGTLDLAKGTNHFELPLSAGQPGFANYRVQIIPAQDALYQNNEMAAFSQIAGPPKVLVVKNPTPRDTLPGTTPRDETKELTAALAASNILADVTDAAGLPSELPSLSAYASVILADVPAAQLSPRQMTALQTYVRDLGGGLVAVGGPSAYGVGGYFRTPLEETLPVEMQIKDQKRRASITIVFVIDHSGSMSETSGGVQKVDLAKEAVVRSIDLLMPTDKVGVIAFDETASWVVPITPLTDPGRVKNLVGTIRADGGTDIFAGVKAAADALPNDDSVVRHILLLTDGGADPTGIAAMVAGLNKNYGITFSTVGVGSDAAAFLPDLAKAGNGLYHFTADPSTIPTIFAEETALATRAYIIEEEFFPQATAPHPIIQGITSVPKLLGYVGTTAKPAAQTVLISDQKDPILAVWQYGLGKSAAWTSDATGRWAKNWVSWDQFARFWAQVVRYTISEGAAHNVNISVQRSGEKAAVTVDAQSEGGDYLNGLALEANVVGPDGQTQAISLTQVAPGRYVGDFTPTTEGAYLIRTVGSDPTQPASTQTTVAQTAGWVLAYSPEYERIISNDPNAAPAGGLFLVRLALLTGGHALGTTADGHLALQELFTHDLKAPARAARPVWPWLLLLAALLLPVDIALRRLVVTRYDLQRAWHTVRAWVVSRAPQLNPQPTPRTEQLSSLFQAKGKAQVKAEPLPAPPQTSAPASTTLPPPTKPSEAARPAPPAAPGAPKPPAPPSAGASPTGAPPTGAPPSGATSTSAALLAANKRARERRDE